MKKIHFSFTAALLLALALASSAWAADAEQLKSEAGAAYDAKDYDTAFRLYSEAAELGDAQAQNEVGILYRRGHGVAQDDAKAVFWYTKAAEQGHAWGQTNLAWFFRNGVGVEKDEKKAVEWYRKAADQGNAEAQNGLGMMYRLGRGVAKDGKQALEWYRKAADQGYLNAYWNVGFMYETGNGVSENYKQAIEWYRKGADQGHKESLKKLGNEIRAGRWKPNAKERAAYDKMESSFPAFSSTTLDDKPVTNEVFAGKKLTMVNFWATWCSPCIKEMPDLARLGKSMPEGTQLVGILVDPGDKEVPRAKDILKKAGAEFLHIITNDAIQDADFPRNFIPTTIFVDSEGQLVGSYIAGTRNASEYRREIERRLKLVERQEARRETRL